MLARQVDMSIWKDISRIEFEDDIEALHRLAPSQWRYFEMQSSKAKRHVTAHQTGGLPVNTERQVVTDFAFLAAWDATPDCVAAATITQRSHPNSVRVTLASNEGIASHVQGAFRKLLHNLERCASCGKLL